MLHASIVGDLVAANMINNLAVKVEEKAVSKISFSNSTEILDFLLTTAEEAVSAGLNKTALQLIDASDVLRSEALDLEDLGLESREADNWEALQERRPDLVEELKQELEQDPDIKPADEEPEGEALSDLGLQDTENKLLDLIMSHEHDQPEDLVETWQTDLDRAIAYADRVLQKQAEANKIPDPDLDLDMTLKELLAEDDLDSHMADVFTEGWEDE